MLIFLQTPELAVLWFRIGLQKRNQWVLAKSNANPIFLYNEEPEDLWLGGDCLNGNRRVLSKIKHPTNTSQKFHAWDDGWMDGSSLIQKWSLKKKLMGISKIKPDSKFSPQSRTGDSLIQKCSLKMGPAGTSKNKCPTNIASKVYAWDDGWMDGWLCLLHLLREELMSNCWSIIPITSFLPALLVAVSCIFAEYNIHHKLLSCLFCTYFNWQFQLLFCCCYCYYSQELEFPFAHQIGPNIVGGNLPFATNAELHNAQ